VVLIGGAIVNTALFLMDALSISRPTVLLFVALNIFLLSLWRTLVRSVARFVRSKDCNYRNIILVGTGGRAKKLIRIIEGHKSWGLRLVGVVGDNIGSDSFFGYPVLGKIGDVPQLIHRFPVEEVLFCLPKSRLDELEELFLLLEDEGINARIAMNFFPHVVAKVCFEELHGVPFLSFTTVSTNEFALAMKRVFDIFVSLWALTLVAPIMLLAAALVKTTSKGPVFFRQERSGVHGRVFRLYKFRSMFADAEERKQALLEANEMDGPVFKIKNDPRITPVGRFMRKMSIDELPQLWNVLMGDMSIVGPRPPLPSEVAQYERWQRRRLSMKPGITCLWQISGRNQIGFNEWMKLDLEYIDNWSLGLDLKIFLRTIPVVLMGRGAA